MLKKHFKTEILPETVSFLNTNAANSIESFLQTSFKVGQIFAVASEGNKLLI